ncbi:MAG: hypothetical protein ABI358_11280 [Ginsengibacter sp.]
MTIKQLTWRLILPLTIISFGTLTKWWYVLPVDSPETLMAGFPFAFVGDGWFTSMSLQFFLIEFSADFIIYFLFWFLIVFFSTRILTQFTISKILIRVFWTLAILTISFWTLILAISEKHIKLKRDWDMQVLVTGYKFTWTNTDRPDFLKYDPNKK